MNKSRPVKLFSATRHTREEFIEKSFLGQSLAGFPPLLQPVLHVRFGNSGDTTIGLSDFYNKCLDNCDDRDIAVLAHDDVYIHSWYLVDQVRDAISSFDIAGVVGNRSPDLTQPSWSLKFKDSLEPDGWQDVAGLSGSLSHHTPDKPYIGYYGETPSPCVLLDGLFLAVNVGKIRAAGVRFDPAFRFHCYDIDFCRSAHQSGLKLGTWPIPVTHASGGSFDSPNWREAASHYLDKWN